jgi:hypothetical protein
MLVKKSVFHISLRYVDRAASRYTPVMKLNLLHCLSSVYSVTIPLHVSGLLVAQHQ